MEGFGSAAISSGARRSSPAPECLTGSAPTKPRRSPEPLPCSIPSKPDGRSSSAHRHGGRRPTSTSHDSPKIRSAPSRPASCGADFWESLVTTDRRLRALAVATFALASCDAPTMTAFEPAYDPTTLTSGLFYHWDAGH